MRPGARGCDNAAIPALPRPVMTPDEPDSDRTQIQPPGSSDRTVAFDKTQVYAPAPPPPPAAPAAPAHDMGNGLPIGTRLGEFELTQLLGEGGFGIVYLANDHSLQRRVALKEYMPSSLASRTGDSQVQVKSERYRETFEAGRKSFINEARLLASFDHPALVKVYRFWEANGTAYMVMPFLEGKTLRDILRGRPQAPDEAWLRGVLGPLSDALQVIHAEQCFHRDIAPDNVMQLPNGRWLLLDFGAARRVIGDMTQALTVILKPGYAPVEQYAEIPGMKQGAWTDVYALAAVVHYAITGRTPPPSVGRLLNDTYKPLVEAAAGRYSEGFLAAIDRALAVRPEQRTQTIEQLRQELDLDSAPPPGATVALPQPTLQAGATGLTQMLGGVPPTAIVPPPSARSVLSPVVMTPAPAPTAAAAAAAPAKGKAALIGIGAGVLVLGAVGFGAWRLVSSPPAPPPAVTQAPAPTPAPQPAPAPAPAAPAPAPVAPPVAVAQARFDPAREFDRIVKEQTADFAVRAEPVKTELSIAKRDEFKFRVTADRDGYVYIVGLSPDGSLALLVPNKNSPTVRVRKGQTWNFPTADKFFLGASEPTGESRMLVMVSSNKRSFNAMQPKAEGPIQVFATGDAAQSAAAAYKGKNSPLAGLHQCASGSDCADDYGAALMVFNTQR